MTFFSIIYIYSNIVLIVHDLESADILAQWKPEADMDYRIELATSWHDDADIYIAVCIMKEDAFILQVLSVEYKDMQSR